MSRPRVRGHGDYGYAQRERCQCDPCIKARRRYQKELMVDHVRGKKRRVPAEPSRVHVRKLMHCGFTYSQIAQAAGLSHSQIRHLIVGNDNQGGKVVEYLLPTTAEAILKVTWRDCDRYDQFFPKEGISRRVRALQYMGHSMRDIADAAGVTESAVYRWMETTYCKRSTLEKLDEVYGRLSMVRGTNERTRWQAYREGYMPPMAWDDATIDDPEAEPDLSGIGCVVQNCSRRLHARSLCKTHYYEASSMRAFEKTRYYKPAVDRMGKKNFNDKDRLLADLQTLKELGYDPERAAQRLGRSVVYIAKIWNEVA